jgi:four helix bundle protein
VISDEGDAGGRAARGIGLGRFAASSDSLASLARGTRRFAPRRGAAVRPRLNANGLPVADSGGPPMSLPFHKLVVWQRADDLFIEIHHLTLQRFPREERFALGSQLRRSAYSVPANVVEGSARESPRERLRFFNIASSSLSEAGYGLHAARRLGYIDESTYIELETRVRRVAAPLNGLIRSTKRKAAVKKAVLASSVALFVAQLLHWIS